ncbi:MAG TPA: ABC-F family ATP-binding cassette domain-containing protein [Candidatus Saccharimonadales bacterium]|nr:ABC-F family ATP-binding cassette domain-containing protein [Candidatus Saccharimonadales bacterium]
MIKINQLSKSYFARELFTDVTFQMNAGERLGLVGRNGHGKSTLFKLILGEEDLDSGQITIPRNYRIGHLEQHLHFTQPTILAEAALGLPEEESHSIYKAEAILFGLGFSHADLEKAPREFSGGFQIRINLAKLLLSEPNLLLLDEPTNYLDITSVRWIARFLTNFNGELILISHDRDFMDRVTTHTAVIHRQKIRKFEGGTAKAYAQIILEDEIHEKTRANEDRKRAHAEAFINRFRAQASKAKMVQSRIKMLEKLPKLDELAEIESLDFEFRYAAFAAKTLLEARNVSFGYTPDNVLFRHINLTVNARDRFGVIGNNGKGKSTLLNVLSGGVAPVTGDLKTHPDMKLGYFGQTNIQRLDPKLTIEQEIEHTNPALTRTQVRNICGTMMFGGDLALKKVSVLSGGEKSRTLLGKILAHPSNLLLLDEPNNHLDMESIDALIESLQNFPGAVMLVTHNEHILRALATKLVVFHRGKAEVFNSGYDEFLEKIGWEEEADGNGARKKPTSRNDYNEKKERGKAERREKARIEKLEAQILKNETALKKYHEQLEIEANRNNLAQITELSRKIGQVKREIEDLYGQYAE